MIYDTPKKQTKVVWGISHLTKPLPKFAKRLGAALTAMAVCGFGYTAITPDVAPVFIKVMAWGGAVGAFLVAFTGKIDK